MASVYRRPVFDTVLERAREPRGHMQVLAGPRQVGKTTLIKQVLGELELPSHFASADDAAGRDRDWIVDQWDIGRRLDEHSGEGAVLVLDEVQKVTRWSDTVKLLWDQDGFSGSNLRVFLLGSSPLLLGRGLTESLAGRFEMIRIPHWSFTEMRDAFALSLDEYLYFGGYPGGAALRRRPERWRDFVLDSIVETTVSRDILLLARVDKPALLRQLFRLGCTYSGQILAFTKMLGQLQDAGNTTTLAHYLDLLGGSGLVTGLQKYSGSVIRQRASSPKLLVLNTGLMTATLAISLEEARSDPDVWGRLVESAIGAHLVNARVDTTYWRDRNREVDFVTRVGSSLTAIEVTSGARKDALPGLSEFSRRYESRRLLVGGQGVPIEEFLTRPADTWIK